MFGPASPRGSWILAMVAARVNACTAAACVLTPPTSAMQAGGPGVRAVLYQASRSPQMRRAGGKWSLGMSISSQGDLRDARKAVTGRSGTGAVVVEAAAGRSGADADRRDRRAGATEGHFRAGEAAAEPAEAKIEAGDRE